MLKKNKLKTYLSLAGVLLIVIIMVYQTKEIKERKAELSDNECLPPLFTFSYPLGVEEITNSEHSLPPIAGITPQIDENGQHIKVDKDNLIVIGDDEIWMVEPLMRYTPSTKNIKEYAILNSDGDLVHPTTFFLGTDDRLYVMAINNTYSGILIALFDNQKDRFDIISPETEIFKRLSGEVVLTIVEDQDGKLWFVSQNSLIRFDPKTKHAEKMLGEKQNYVPLMNTLVISSDNALFLAVRKIKRMTDGETIFLDLQIIKYEIKTGDIQHYGYPSSNTNTVTSLFLDHKERLWVSDYGYLEIDADGSWTWNQIIRSPIFINDRSGNYRYTWARPAPKVETRGRYLWFTFSGLARLDLETYNWCLVSETDVRNIAKDSQDNLWFISDRQLYKYEFHP